MTARALLSAKTNSRTRAHAVSAVDEVDVNQIGCALVKGEWYSDYAILVYYLKDVEEY